jgi:hypothetical protein
VFHELARHMQTRQLIAGDTLLLEEEKSFCLVVDGLVQVFVKSPPRLAQPDDEDEEWEGGQGYQLLTEAKNGGTHLKIRELNSSTTIEFILHPRTVHRGNQPAQSSRHYEFIDA